MSERLPAAISLSRKPKLHRVTTRAAQGPVLEMAHHCGTEQIAGLHVMPDLLPDFRIGTFDHAGARLQLMDALGRCR